MIIQLAGNVEYPITLDPTVWIFDDRKILFDNAFTPLSNEDEKNDTDELQRASERFEREVFRKTVRPPVNKSISRFEREKILENTYVMPIKDFLETSEFKEGANQACLKTTHGDQIISLDQLNQCVLLFAKDGKPIKDDGPVHLYFGDGSNKETPIKGINKIIIE